MYPILPCSHCVQEADGPVLVWSGVPFLHEQQEEEEEAAGVSAAGPLTAAKMSSSKQHAAASTSTSLRSWDAKDTEKFSGCNVVQYAHTYVIMYAYLYKSCTYVHVRTYVRTYVDLYCPYDITIGKFIYTGCVTIVMLHGPSGN